LKLFSCQSDNKEYFEALIGEAGNDEEKEEGSEGKGDEEVVELGEASTARTKTVATDST
jgi:hypothetical protein